MDKLGLMSNIHTVRRAEPPIPPGTRVHTLSAPERGLHSQKVHHLDTPGSEADTGRRLRRVSSTHLLDSMIRQMGGATIPSAKGSYVDIVV